MATHHGYDAVPYDDCPLAETHPDSLAVIGRLFGIDVAPVDQCRVLELGCAGGGNLIPMAYHWPGSEFIGVELSERQAAQAKALSEELALDNLQIIQGDILELDNRLGWFDYIVVHGVFSWVPKQVQDHILRLCRELLNPNGIAYISYNTLPGWNIREPIRHMMLHHARHETTSEARAQKGVEMLGMLVRGLPTDTQPNMQSVLKQEVMQLIDMNVSYLMHDYMEVHNTPLYFHQFMERAEASQLRYLADTNLYSMFGQDQPVAHTAELDDIESLIEYEQYLDFFNVRFFRQSLLCVAELDINYDVAIDKLQDWYMYASFMSNDADVDLSTVSEETFVDSGNRSYNISHPLTKAAVVLLSEAYPNGYSYNQLSALVQELVVEHGDADLARQTDALLTELFGLYVSRGLRLSLVRRDIQCVVSERPQACRLARAYSRIGKSCVASVHHHMVEIDTVDRFVLTRLTGENTVDDICATLVQELSVDAGFKEQLVKKGFSKLSEAISLQENVRQLIYHYAAHGLLDSEVP